MPNYENPAENEMIPSGDVQLTPEQKAALDNNFLPDSSRPAPAVQAPGFILEKLQNNEMAQFGTLLIQRHYRNNNGQSGGEQFSILDTESGVEVKGIELSDLAKVKDTDDLQRLIDGTD